ncbi:cubilin-like [Amphibalanus amphitrite]|uniref:cubilin-like n=1 Tax=Amphibalanus amphitrite TaxID=1232801 RepID=UPI001C920A88|nr:cubilin-like [Amphibalanus amphitrite]
MRPSQQLVCLLAVALTAVAAATITSKDASGQLSAIAAQRMIDQRSLDKATLLQCDQGKQHLLPGVYYMQSPNYKQDDPGNYTNDYSCNYDLTAADDNGILRFDCFFFQLEDSDAGCSKDSFGIYTEDILEVFCGTDSPKTRFVKSIGVHFKTDASVTDKGFFCTVMSKEAVAGCDSLPCGKRYLAPGTYSLLSQNYPDNYGTNIYCKWELVASDPSNTVDFSCSSFDMISWDNSCEWDWMKVDGVRHCNNNKPAPQQFTGGVTVEYSTPDLPHKTRKGFKCTVTVN